MKTFKKFVPYRRKLDGRTNYRKRLKLLMSGVPRMVIRKTNKNIIVQFVEYAPDGDKVIITVNSHELKKLDWKYSTSNIPAAYLTGLLAGKKAQAKKITHAIADLGLQVPAKSSRLYGAIKGAIDSGMDIPAAEDIFPNADRLAGKHIAAYATSGGPFKTKPLDIEKVFDDTKKKIIGNT